MITTEGGRGKAWLRGQLHVSTQISRGARGHAMNHRSNPHLPAPEQAGIVRRNSVRSKEIKTCNILVPCSSPCEKRTRDEVQVETCVKCWGGVVHLGTKPRRSPSSSVQSRRVRESMISISGPFHRICRVLFGELILSAPEGRAESRPRNRMQIRPDS